MCDKLNNLAEQENQQDFIKIDEVLGWALTHKWHILASVIIFSVLAFLYTARTPKEYQASASVMIRANSHGQAEFSELAAFSDLGIGNMGLDVYNELQALRSPALMLDVVNALNLNVTYTSRNHVGLTTDWYGKSPVTAAFPVRTEIFEEMPVGNFSFNINFTGKDKYQISDIAINGREIDAQPINGTYGNAVKAPFGTLILTPTATFAGNKLSRLTVSYTDPEKMAEAYAKRLSVELADKFSTVINFNLTDVSPKRAEDVINALIVAYNNEWVSYTHQSNESTSKFINERLLVIEQELGMVDADIEKFKSNNQLLDLVTETASVTSESNHYAEQAFIAGNQLAIAKFVRDYLNDNTKKYELLPSNTGIGNSAIETQIAEYNKMMIERQRLIASSSEHSPLVADMNKELDMMRKAIMGSVDNHISTLNIQVSQIAQKENKISGQITAGPGKARELLSIERQQKIKEQLYLYLLQKREENELKTNIIVNNTRIIKPGKANPNPVSPNPIIIIFAGFMVGLILPFGFMIVGRLCDFTIRTREDLECLNIPIIGEIPLTGKDNRINRLRLLLKMKPNKTDNSPKVLVKHGKRDAINEAFRVTRTNFDFIQGNNPPAEAIMLTSYNQGSGKTFTSANFATVMALKGKGKVVVVDLDIRKGTFSKAVSNPSKGVCTYLNSQCELEEIIAKAHTLNNPYEFDVIPAGSIPPNPVELLLSDQLDLLISELKQRYQYVLLDCPPEGVVADADIIARVADRTVFVVRSGLLNKRLIPEIGKIANSKKYRNFMLIINGVEFKKSHYGLKYGYGYGYGYRYGSTHDEN